jgi:hypothetical protein
LQKLTTIFLLVSAVDDNAGFAREELAVGAWREIIGRLSNGFGGGSRLNRKQDDGLSPDFDDDTTRILNAVRPFTKVGPETVFALVEAVRYVTRHSIEGDVVECGVWQGGSAMAMAHALMAASDGEVERDIWLYDTFSGMSQPRDVDVNWRGDAASERFEALKLSEQSSNWCHSALGDVQRNLSSTGFPRQRLRFIEGMVEQTIPRHMPEKIAVLRLDTDWYASTKHELVHLFPRVSPYGIIIIDDYGYWQGARKAVDEYIAENRLCLYLHRIDHSARAVIKPF